MSRILIVLTLALLGSLAKAGDWTQFRADATGTGAATELVPPVAAPTPLTLSWSATLPGGAVISSPAVAGSRVYVGAADGGLRCLDLMTGATIWTFTTGDGVRASPAYYKGRVYFASLDGTLYALHAGTGAVEWSYYNGTRHVGSPLVTAVPGPADMLFIGAGTPTDEIRAYDAITGAFLWAQPTGQPVGSTPAFHAGLTPKVIVGNGVGIWSAFDAVSGAPLWSFKAPDGTSFSPSAAVEGDRAIVISGAADRKIHVLDAETGVQIKEVLAVPPAFASVGGGVGGEVEPFFPQSYLDVETLHELENLLDKTERDVLVDAWAQQRGFDAARMKEYLDHLIDGTPTPNQQSPGGPFWVNLSRVVQSSSPAVAGGRAFVTHREFSGNGNDEFFTSAVDVTAAAPPSASNLWGTSPLTKMTEDFGLLPSPAISAGQYVYYAHATTLHIVDMTDWTDWGSVDVGSFVIGGPVLANGRVLVTTSAGKVICYASGNNPPTAPTTFNPTGGANVTGGTPTMFWSGQADPESAPGSLASRLEFAYGWTNSDLETTLDKTTIDLPAGASSYQIVPPVPPNTHVFWRVRVEDPNGAQSGWSPIQDFWVNQDPNPPLPPGNVTATPGDAQVTVSWSPSPSPDVEMVRLRYKLSTDSWTTATLVDNIPSAAVSQIVGGLTNGFSYDFSLAAVDYGENESAAVVVSAVPVAPISIGGSGSFGTIQEALNTATPGQTVVLQPGVYVESVVIPPGVSLMGQSAGNTVLDGGGAAVIVQVNGTYGVDPVTEIAYLTITNGGIGIDAANADVYVHHVVIHALSSDAIVGSSGGRLRVEFATITSNGGDGISGTSPITSVDGCIIEQNGGFGADLVPSASVSYTDFYLNALGPLGGPVVETGNLGLMPVFIDAAYHVQDGSVTVDKGDPAIPATLEPTPNGGRVNVGAYGNTAEAALTVGAGFTGGETGGGVGPGSGPGGGGGGGGCGLSVAGSATPSMVLVLAALAVGLGIGGRGRGHDR